MKFEWSLGDEVWLENSDYPQAIRAVVTKIITHEEFGKPVNRKYTLSFVNECGMTDKLEIYEVEE